jgi:hypothetical protein
MVTDQPAHEAEEEWEEGGDPACWAGLVCPECGAVTTEGHREGCSFGADTAGQDEAARESRRPFG